MKVVKFIIQAIWPFRFYLIGPFIMILIHSLDLSFRPYLTKLLVDTVSVKAGPEAITEMMHIIILYIILLFAVPIGWRLYDWSCLKYEPLLKGYIANFMISKLTLQTHNFFQKNFPGTIANKVNDTVKNLPQLVTLAINAFSMNIVGILVAIYALWSIHIWFAIAMSLWALLFIAMSIFVVQRFSDLAKSTAEASSKVVGLIVDILSNISNVRFYNKRNYELTQLDNIQNQYTKSTKKKRWFSLKFYLIQGILFSAYQAISLILLVYLYGKSKVTAGDFAMLISINMSIVTSLWHMTDDMRLFSENWGVVEQAIRILDTNIKIQDTKNATAITVTKPDIIFENLCFHHKGDKPLFNNLNITIKPYQKIGLVGYSGSGKTTFVNLILRLYDPTSGQITIENQNIKNVTQESLRKIIAIIPQDTSLFHRSIIENIRYGNLEASDEEVVLAAKKASAHDFITALPHGYKSEVGEKGVKLSAGQRQRILIARALLKNAPIIIFDEATSNIDSITENYIQNNLNKIMDNKTAIVISHKLSTLKTMDRILVFDAGKIVQDGHPDILITEKGLFRELWEAQSNGVLPTNLSQ